MKKVYEIIISVKFYNYEKEELEDDFELGIFLIRAKSLEEALRLSCDCHNIDKNIISSISVSEIQLGDPVVYNIINAERTNSIWFDMEVKYNPDE